MADSKDLKPIPDPSVLTTEQLLREINTLRALLETKIASTVKDIDRLEERIDGIPEITEEKVASLQALHEEKFNSIQTQFKERDTRTEQTSRDSKVAVDAALSAAKEAVGEQNRSSALAITKSETAASKQIDQQGQLITTSTGALNDKIDDLKERISQ